ncbi:uncharacterized protein LOC114529589 isoform X2 [Dendronephthya gigantea]|uniref:uncharacterized protein LOC114529589 isoform X2 n=1 Tax=Dendronephthya gigantea TaxID=151771 RepID=UPI00106A3720|nr:uncharacterized protein LOC114529589 isoform X2 [Dendronephthya gigantea]
MASLDLQEKANFSMLSRLLVDKGTEALRITFDTINSPVRLPGVLAAKKATLQRLKPRVINKSQWDLLFPPSGNPPDSKTFDVTLLTVLLRNICGFPSTGWDVMPPDTDRSMQANIARIKCYRNEVYAHVTSTRVDNSTFESLWKKISQTLVELGIPQSDVDIEKSPLGPEEEIYVQKLETIQYALNHLIEIAEENRDGINELQKEKESDEDLLRNLAKHNFKNKIQRKVKFFQPGTRMWLLKDVNEWFCESDSGSRVKLITAGPGFGKSVFAAKICEDFEKNGMLAACHFCDFSDSNLRDPMVMLQSLASQMCESVLGFKEKLLDQLKRPHQVQNLKDAFRIYLQNPLDELQMKEPRLLVIDGLDESAADNKNEITHLIAEYFPDLPGLIKILVTSRLSDDEKTDITNVDANNQLDLELYFKECLPSLVDKKVNDISLVSVVVEKCAGSFLYAYHFQYGLKTRYDIRKITNNEVMKFLPQGLNSIYEGYFKRLEDELKAIKHEKFNVLKILEMLAASKGPLPLIFVAQAFGLAADCRETKEIINKINEIVSCLLYVSDDMLTVFHKSVIDWLLAKGYKDHQYAVKVDDGHRSLWLLCENVFQKIVKHVRSGHNANLTNDVIYALEHGMEHLEECNMEECVFWSVDVIILFYMLLVKPRRRNYVELWSRILGSFEIKSEDLRARISWHVVEFEILYQFLFDENFQYTKFSGLLSRTSISYLEAVLTHPQEGYFSEDEKKIARFLLSKAHRLFGLNTYKDSFLPRAVWKSTGVKQITAFCLSKNKKKVAVVERKSIHVLSLPTLVEIMNYSTEFKEISCCTFSPDDSLILFGKLGTALNIAEREEVPFFLGNEETFLSCTFSPNGKRLVTSDGSNTIKLWDVAKQRSLTLLCSESSVDFCFFSITGLFIIGNSEQSMYSRYVGSSFCVWNAITFQRSDKRRLCHGNMDERGVLKCKECERCFHRGFEEPNSKRLEITVCQPLGREFITYCPWICKGVEFIFSLGQYYGSKVLEIIPMAAVVALNYLLSNNSDSDLYPKNKATALENNMWLCADRKKLMVLKTLASAQEQSCLSLPTMVYSSSFSPDGSRLASCTSDGYINVWNVYTSKVEQRFESNQEGSRFLCLWSKNFLSAISESHGIPKLTRYPVDNNLEILSTSNQQVSLHHLLSGDERLTSYLEGFLIFELGCNKTVEILDVRGVDGPVVVKLPGIEPKSVEISTGGAFIFGYNNNNAYIWKRNAEVPALYEVFYRSTYDDIMDAIFDHEIRCLFSSDSKVAVLSYTPAWRIDEVDLDTGHSKRCLLTELPNVLFNDSSIIDGCDKQFNFPPKKPCWLFLIAKAIWCFFHCLSHQIFCCLILSERQLLNVLGPVVSSPFSLNGGKSK